MTRLWLDIPGDFEPEVRWVLEWLMREVFGLPCGEVRVSSRVAICGDDGRELRLPLTFFEMARVQWLQKESTPEAPTWRDLHGLSEAADKTKHQSIPDFFPPELAQSTPIFDLRGRTGILGLDVLGGLFYLMTRYEEAALETRDSHDRFPAVASTLKKHHLLYRAVGNEYIEILWAAMKRVWPRLERKALQFRVVPSHDVDSPSAYWGSGVNRLSKLTIKSLLKSGPMAAFWTMAEASAYPKLGWRHDPYDTIDDLMEFSESIGETSTFFYIPERTNQVRDLGMPLDHPQVEAQWRRIAARGHEIGVHPGYETYRSPERLRSGVQRIRDQLDRLGIRQPLLGSRQHYLRWDPFATAGALEAAGVDYDSTLGFADQVGFRCGTCYEFPMYDVVNRRPLRLRQRPLVLMDCSLMDDRYMGLGTGDEALRVALELKNECRKYHGDFTVLWHNTRMEQEQAEHLYTELIGAYAS